MTAAELQLVIKAKDQSKKAFATFKGRVSKTSSQIKRFTKNASDRFKKLSRGLATFAKRGAIALVAFGAAAGYAFVKALRETIAFEMQMAKVSTMLDAKSKKLLPEFRKAISGMALEFGEATESLTDGAYDILSAMVAPKEAMEVLKTGANAAIAGFTDTKTAISALLTAMKAFGIKTSKVTDISDKFLTVQERGRTTLAEMAPVFGRLAAMAASAGGSFDETAAAMATVTRAGLPTVLAITGLSAAYRTFLISSDEAKEAAKRAGFELTQQWLKTHSLRQALEMIHKTRQVELKDVFATSEAILAAGLLMKNLGGFTKDTTAITNDFADATKRSADKIKSQLGFQLKRLRSSFVELGKAMTEKFGEKLKPIIEEANRTMPHLTELFGEIGVALADKIGPHMERFVEYLRSVTKEKLAEQYEKLKEAFQKMVPYIQGAAVAMAALYAASHLTVIEIGLLLAGYKLIYEIGKKIGGAGRWLMGGTTAGMSEESIKKQVKWLKKVGTSEKEIAAFVEKTRQQRANTLRLQKEGKEIMKEDALVLDYLIDRSKKALKGELSMAGEFESAISGFKSKVKEAKDAMAEGFKSTKEGLEPAKKIKDTAEKQKEIAEANNKSLRDRIKIYADLKKAMAQKEEFRFKGRETFGAEEKEFVVTKEHPAGIPVEQFDKIVADAKAKNEALSKTINTLLLKYKDKDVTDDVLKEAFDTAFKEMLSFETSAINTAKQQAAAAVKIGNQSAQNSSAIKQIGNKLSSVIKTVSAVTQRQKQLEGQLA